MIGAVLAGGAGSRMGGDKPARLLAGRPLVAYPLEALWAACERVALVCKPREAGGTARPGATAASIALPAGDIWDDEPLEPRHPAAGIAHALDRAGARVLVCAADMPFVTADDCRALIDAAASDPDALAVIAAVRGGRTAQPTFGVYAPAAAAVLRTAATRGDPLRRVAEELSAVVVELPAERLRSVNSEEELAVVERELRG